jgi:phosphatidylserine/phosphatidylglycerophosphate/cardiolipin synthase-like enzyme
MRAAKRGVQVRAILNSADLVPILQSIGVKAKVLRDRRTLHVKLLIFDGKTLVIGSHNFTRNAFSHNIEASVAVAIPEGVTRFSEFFENLYNL